MKNIKSLCISEVIFKGFTISMDVPSDGLFIAPPSSLEELVYIRTLTYGVTAYFVMLFPLKITKSSQEKTKNYY